MSEGSFISVVDDDQSMRMALVRLVRSIGHEARGFASAEDFLQSECVDRADCIITDIQMPGMTGIELKRYLAANHREQPVIMITARSEADLEQRARDSGAFCFLRKPFEAEDLIGCLERALNSSD